MHKQSLLAVVMIGCILTGCTNRTAEQAQQGARSGRDNTSQNLSPADVSRRITEGRAVEAVIWGMPAVNYDLMYQAAVNQVHGNFNQIVFWSRFPDWKNQTLTPNPNAIYLMPFVNTKGCGTRGARDSACQ